MTDRLNRQIRRAPAAPIVISGIGLVTPLGWDVDKVWERMCAGESGLRGRAHSDVTGKTYGCARVEGFNLDDVIRTGRVRRSSPISHFAVGAAELALRDARLAPDPRIGVIVAVSMGGVSYSRSFHQQFVTGGARTASPMLFPETVFNAPASHIAAVFGLTDANYTLIGDSGAAANAIAMAADLIQSGMLQQCLVIGAEEYDWIVVEAFRRFRLSCKADGGAETMRPFDRNRTGFIGGEGAVALVLESGDSAAARKIVPRARLRSCDRGFPFRARCEIGEKLGAAISGALETAVVEWPDVGGVVCAANGTFVDEVEATALARCVSGRPVPLPVTSVKSVMGEAHAASCLFQIATAALAAQHRQLPPTVGTIDSILDATRLRLLTRTEPIASDVVMVLCIGFNEQVSVAMVGEHGS